MRSNNGLRILCVALVTAACARPAAPVIIPEPAPAPNAAPPAPPPPAIPPGFAMRGVIEGFYGPPWSHQDRLDILRFEGKVGMNAYFYAPKDDPFHRERWRDPYPADQIARLGELVRVGRENGVDIWFAVSPGLSMTYSDTADYRLLLAKLESVAGIGIRHVALFLDDVPQELLHDADKARFHSVAEAHAYVINTLRHDLDARGLALAVVQTTYTNGFGSLDYLRELGALVEQPIPLAWTGIEVVSPNITVPQARAWSAMIRRPPLVWDNYPVNDFARWRLFLSPLRGRAPDLGSAIAGYLSNPMNEAHASMLPLWTIADYVRHPETYDPDSSLARAMTALYGANAGVMRPWVDAYGDDFATTTPIEALYVPTRRLYLPASRDLIAAMRTSLADIARLAQGDSATWAPLGRELAPFADSAGARFAAVQRDTMFRVRGDTLVFRAELDRGVVPRARKAPTVDGNVADWPRTGWHRMFSRNGLDARAAFAATKDTLYVALDVADTSTAAMGADSVTAGDHAAIVIGADASGRTTRMTGQDLVLFAAPAANGGVVVRPQGLPLTAFYQEILAGREAYPFGPFFLESYGGQVAPSWGATATGVRGASSSDAKRWRLELAIPRSGIPVARDGSRRVMRMAIDVSDAKPGPRHTASLGPRNYPANPATYTEVVLPR